MNVFQSQNNASCKELFLILKILVSSSLNVFLLHRWKRKSPPSSNSRIKYKLDRSWNALNMFIIKLWFSYCNICSSFITECTLFLDMILDLDIIFIAKNSLFFLFYTFHTLPKPPLPIGYIFSNKLTDIYMLLLFSFSALRFRLQFPIRL